MALDYADLSEDLGKLIKHYNGFHTTALAIAAAVDEIEDEFNDENQEAAIDGLRPGVENAWKSEYVGRRSQLATYAQNRLTERISIVLEVGAISTSISEVLSKFIEQMDADGESVNASVAAIGNVTAHADNLGNGTVLTTLILDGITSPGSRSGLTFPAHHLYKGLSSQLPIGETHTLRCTSDSFNDGATEGGETFSWEGRISDVRHGVQALEGTGAIASIQAIHANTPRYLQNPDFENFATGNTPDSWTIASGNAGVHIFQDTSTFYHGASALKLTGNGTLGSISLTQAVDPSLLQSNKAYGVTARIASSGNISTGNLTLAFEGNGYTPGVTEKISIDSGNLPTAGNWTLKHFFVNTPANIPDDFRLALRWSGTPQGNKSIWVDDLGMDAVNYGAGFGVIIVRGNSPFVREDRYVFATTNTEGVIQKWFRQVFGVQLPSDAGAAETILDSVAT